MPPLVPAFYELPQTPLVALTPLSVSLSALNVVASKVFLVLLDQSAECVIEQWVIDHQMIIDFLLNEIKGVIVALPAADEASSVNLWKMLDCFQEGFLLLQIHWQSILRIESIQLFSPSVENQFSAIKTVLSHPLLWAFMMGRENRVYSVDETSETQKKEDTSAEQFLERRLSPSYIPDETMREVNSVLSFLEAQENPTMLIGLCNLQKELTRFFAHPIVLNEWRPCLDCCIVLIANLLFQWAQKNRIFLAGLLLYVYHQVLSFLQRGLWHEVCLKEQESLKRFSQEVNYAESEIPVFTAVLPFSAFTVKKPKKSFLRIYYQDRQNNQNHQNNAELLSVIFPEYTVTKRLSDDMKNLWQRCETLLDYCILFRGKHARIASERLKSDVMAILISTLTSYEQSVLLRSVVSVWLGVVGILQHDRLVSVLTKEWALLIAHVLYSPSRENEKDEKNEKDQENQKNHENQAQVT